MMKGNRNLCVVSSCRDVLPSVANLLIPRQAFSEKSWIMDLTRRACLKQLAGWTFATNTIPIAFGTPISLACQNGHRGFEAEFVSMGSKINLRWYSSQSSQDRIVESATQIAAHWVQVLSDYDPNSQAMLACEQADAGHWVPLSTELWNVVTQCDQWHRWSDGAFDAALGSITRIRRQRKLATSLQWSQAQQSSGWKLLELDHANQSIRFLKAGVRFDFGAIGKGIVVDQIAEKMREMGIDRYVVNASGNMRIGKSPPEKSGWPISIDMPSSRTHEISTELFRLRLGLGGVATSGDRWQRFPDAVNPVSVERTSHIIEPTTGMGLSGHQSVTIFAENAADADAAATATCVRARRDLAGWLETLATHKPNLHGIVLLKENDSAPTRLISTYEMDMD